MARRFVVATAVLVASGVLLAGCGRKAEEKAAEKMIERATGGQADVDIQAGKVRVRTDKGEAEFTGEGAAWPDDLPQEVPKLEDGRLIGVNRLSQEGSESWVLAFENVDRTDFRDFLAEMRRGGWKIGMTTSVDDAEIVQASMGDVTLVATYHGADRGASVQVHRTPR